MTDDTPTVGDFVDVRDVHPDYETMECWNCGETERIGPNRMMRVCHHCFMDNAPTESDTASSVKGPDGELYTDYRLLWYGDIPLSEARERYERSTRDVRERFERDRARDRVVNV